MFANEHPLAVDFLYSSPPRETLVSFFALNPLTTALMLRAQHYLGLELGTFCNTFPMFFRTNFVEYVCAICCSGQRVKQREVALQGRTDCSRRTCDSP